MYVHVRVRLGKSLEKVKKKVLGNVRKKVEKVFTKILQVVQVKERRKNFGTFPREQRPERGLRLPRVFLNSPQLLTNGPPPHMHSIHIQPSSVPTVRMYPWLGFSPLF